MTAKDRLIQTILSRPEAKSGGAIVTIREFFTDNGDGGSIGCNLPHHPGLSFFHARLREIAERPDVDAVWLEIYDWDEGDWAFSENVLIKGRISEDVVMALADALQASEVWRRDFETPHSRDGRLTGQVWNLCWD